MLFTCDLIFNTVKSIENNMQAKLHFQTYKSDLSNKFLKILSLYIFLRLT